jgi:hypothetical protein
VLLTNTCSTEKARGGREPDSFRPRPLSLAAEDIKMGLILLIILIILLLGGLPAWPYSRNWGYGPSGMLGLLLVILLVLMLLNVGPFTFHPYYW